MSVMRDPAVAGVDDRAECTLVRPAASDDDYRAARTLFTEYAAWLGIDLCFQGFTEELATLPGKYAPPMGRLFLAFDSDKSVVNVAGCVAIRPLQLDAKTSPGATTPSCAITPSVATTSSCELKRLWVRDAFRGLGLGHALTIAAVDAARAIGYRSIKLDTLPLVMPNAGEMYRSFGFVECAPYYHNPIPGSMYMELAL